MDYEEFETIAVGLKEEETKLLRDKAAFSAMAVNNHAASALGSIWGCGTQCVNTLARIWEEVGPDDIYPDVPLSLYRAALDAADGTDRLATQWLLQALDEGWSSRQLRDAAGLLKGKHFSDMTFQGQADITEWDVPTGRFTAVGLPLSGEKPEQARVTIREVLGQ